MFLEILQGVGCNVTLHSVKLSWQNYEDLMFAHDSPPVQMGMGCGDPDSVRKGNNVHFWGGNRIRGNSGKQEGATHLDKISTAQVSQETAMKFVSIPQVGSLGPASHFSYLSPACGHALSGALTAQTVDSRSPPKKI